MARILIIDDDENFSEMLSDMVERAGHDVVTTATIKGGLEKAAEGSYEVVFLDIHLPDGSGLDILQGIKAAPSSPEIIIITGFDDSGAAELALKNGVWDYIKKPSSIKEMQLALLRALQYRKEKGHQTPPAALRTEGIIGRSPVIGACLNLVAKAAHGEANVLITGETGTGKELFALSIHNNGPRANKSFVVVDCASLPQNLVESTLFGHEKGSFTGADKARDGLVKQAHGGTLFLDEIGELPLSIQRSFLRVLQMRSFRPIGSDKEITSDFRLISATNRNLDKMVEEGQFREDLLFRIRTLQIDLPALREHPEDIRELLIHYIARLCEQYGIGNKGFSPEFLAALQAHDWPGNVREFISTLEKSISEAFQQPTLYPKHLPTDIRIKLKKSELDMDSGSETVHELHPSTTDSIPALKTYREEVIANAERQYLERLIKASGGKLKEICKVSGLSRPRLYALLKKYNLSRQNL
ncbi:MAG: sigma-54-dependent Fis family transcriptional regulator [Syntrophorhabdaceae bacterium]|nr:sigma-54-dependent Fis family transcriptional regulator [Syntrophorhabdaceae bacterium]